MKKSSGKICRLELVNLKWVEEFLQCAKTLRSVGWFYFFGSVSGYNVELTKYFSKNYWSNSSMNFQTLNFKVSEVTIIEATCLSIEGEWWFKNHLFEIDLILYLFPGYEKLYWSKGIHLNNVKQEWRDVLSIVHGYIAYEGRFATVFRYHLRFLLHLNG